MSRWLRGWRCLPRSRPKLLTTRSNWEVADGAEPSLANNSRERGFRRDDGRIARLSINAASSIAMFLIETCGAICARASASRTILKAIAPSSERPKGFDIARIVFEATGAYHRLFQQAMVEVGLPWVKVNPCRARRFAQATGKLAKTDRRDALMLARMGAVLDLETRDPRQQDGRGLEELVNARDALIKDRVAALNRQAIAVSPLIKRQLAQRLRQIDGQIEAIDRRLKTLRNADSDLCQRFDILTSIPGIGEVTANVLVVETPRARASRARPGRQPRRSRTCPQGQRPDPWKAIHPRRAPTSQTGSLHARPQRHPIEP